MASTSLVLDCERTRRAITLAGHTQASAAAAARIIPSHLSRLVRGKRSISGPLLRRLADALGCETTDLVGEALS